ncbi:hypothetical protein F2Q69_00035011 [Brassica cretica]|uniref:Uncharacterized protein n=1 Tax=Brassica cretica TaxID=69181 RepID=A0A8S9SAT8_BRACR|nr:hypothetical protein F2Q69_00035011 [Brassica cretica]
MKTRRECVMLVRCSRARNTSSGTEMPQLIIWRAGMLTSQLAIWLAGRCCPGSPYGKPDKVEAEFWLSLGYSYGWGTMVGLLPVSLLVSRKSSIDGLVYPFR